MPGYTTLTGLTQKNKQDSFFVSLQQKVLDPNIDQQTKEKLCEEQLQFYIESPSIEKPMNRLGGDLSHLPPAITAPILLYSPIKILSAYRNYQQRYAVVCSDFCDEYFATTLAFLAHNPQLFSKQGLKLFIQRIKAICAQLTEQRHPYQDESNYLWYETLAKWERDSLIKLIAQNFDQELRTDYAKFKETLQKSLEKTNIQLRLRSEFDKLIFEKLLDKYAAHPKKLNRYVAKFDKQDIQTLDKIYTDHGLNTLDMLKRHLIDLAKETNALNHPHLCPGLFFSYGLEYLGAEALSIAPQLASLLPPGYYAKHDYAFEPIRSELFKFWIENKPKQITEIVKAVIARPKRGQDIEHFFFVLNYLKLPPSFYDKLAILLSNGLTKDEFIKVYSVLSEKDQYKLLRAALTDASKALATLKDLSATFKAGNYSAVFLRQLLKQLRTINPQLSQEAEKLFNKSETTDDLETDLQMLAKIMSNASLSHDEKRSECRRLENLNEALRDANTDTCPIVIKMFKTIPQQCWPDLFVYFDAAIICWSFPEDDTNKRQFPRKNTWVDFRADWENFLYGTLTAILTDMSKNNYRSNPRTAIIQWGLACLDQAFTQTEKYMPGLVDGILKKFFLNNAPNCLDVFTALHNSYDQNEKRPTYVKESVYNQIASWLPNDNIQRNNLLAALLKFDHGFEEAVRVPFVRNNLDIARIAHILIMDNSQHTHIINFIERYPFDTVRRLFKNLYRYEPALSTLIQSALTDVSTANFPEKKYIQFSLKLLSVSKIAKINIFELLDSLPSRDDLINSLQKVEALEESPLSSSYKLAFTIVNHYHPEGFKELLDKHIQDKIQRNNFDSLCDCLSAAQKIDKQFVLPKETERLLAVYLTKQISKMDSLSPFEIQVMSRFIPNFERQFLKAKSNEILDDNRMHYTHKDYLDNLVRQYGYPSIYSICKELKMFEFCKYLEKKFNRFPDLLQQTDEAIKTYHQFFKAHQNEIGSLSVRRFNISLREAIAEAAMNTNQAALLDIDIKRVCENSKISPTLAALLPPLRIKSNQPQLRLSSLFSWLTPSKEKTVAASSLNTDLKQSPKVTF